MSYAIFQPASVDPIFSIAIRNGIRRPPRKFSQWLIEELVIPDGPVQGRAFPVSSPTDHTPLGRSDRLGTIQRTRFLRAKPVWQKFDRVRCPTPLSRVRTRRESRLRCSHGGNGRRQNGAKTSNPPWRPPVGCDVSCRRKGVDPPAERSATVSLSPMVPH